MGNLPYDTITQFGGLGVLALFAWVLLKSVLKQQDKLAGLLNNHLTKLLEKQEMTNTVLTQISKRLEENGKIVREGFREAEKNLDERFEKLGRAN